MNVATTSYVNKQGQTIYWDSDYPTGRWQDQYGVDANAPSKGTVVTTTPGSSYRPSSSDDNSYSSGSSSSGG